MYTIEKGYPFRDREECREQIVKWERDERNQFCLSIGEKVRFHWAPISSLLVPKKPAHSWIQRWGLPSPTQCESVSVGVTFPDLVLGLRVTLSWRTPAFHSV